MWSFGALLTSLKLGKPSEANNAPIIALYVEGLLQPGLAPCPRHPKYLKNRGLGVSKPWYLRSFNPRALEYEIFGLVDVQG